MRSRSMEVEFWPGFGSIDAMVVVGCRMTVYDAEMWALVTDDIDQSSTLLMPLIGKRWY